MKATRAGQTWSGVEKNATNSWHENCGTEDLGCGERVSSPQENCGNFVYEMLQFGAY